MRLYVDVAEDGFVVFVGEKQFDVTSLLLEDVDSQLIRKTLLDQLQLDLDFGYILALALDQKRKLEAELESVSKSLYKEYRSQFKDPKENQIKAEIVEDPRYKEALEKKIRADFVVDFMKHTVERMLEDRRVILGRIADWQKSRAF